MTRKFEVLGFLNYSFRTFMPLMTVALVIPILLINKASNQKG